VNISDITRVILLLDFSTGVPVPKHLQNKPKDNHENKADDKEKESGGDIQHPDQRAYLDHITSLYGYGVPDTEDSANQSNSKKNESSQTTNV